jgi:hypothetical protein
MHSLDMNPSKLKLATICLCINHQAIKQCLGQKGDGLDICTQLANKLNGPALPNNHRKKLTWPIVHAALPNNH